MLPILLGAGCAAAPRNITAIDAYYRYDFTSAREALRADAMRKNDEQVLLNNARLGIAALADGDLDEAELALGRSFDLLSTAGLNRDRTTAAILVHEGVRIWKGEPFEQALMYHTVAAMYAVMGDWENARAAAANSLFRLTDFGRHQTPQRLARRAAIDPTYLETAYTAVDTDFALGFLMQGIGASLSSEGGEDELFDAAVMIDPDLAPLTNVLRSGAYDTLLIVHWGKGPTKIAYGPDDALVRFSRQEYGGGPLEVRATFPGQPPALRPPRSVEGEVWRVPAVADISRMAEDHRWNNLEDIRRAKSAIGDVLVAGGAVTTYVGVQRRSAEAALAGLGAMAAGLLTKSGAKADTRYLEFAPHAVYLVPLLLEEPADLHISVAGDAKSRLVLPDFEPGTSRSPRAVYVRLLGPGSLAPQWLDAREPVYGNDHTGVRPGDYPWILGGYDLSTPTQEVLEAYQAGGHLTDFTLEDLLALYETEDILIGSGAETRPGRLRNPSFRHILEGGTGLFTPERDSMAYKRLMFRLRQPYGPKSEHVRNLAEQMRVIPGAEGAEP